MAARIFGAVGCSRLRAESTLSSDRGTGVDPTHSLTPTLTLTLSRTLSPGPESGPRNGRETNRLRRFFLEFFFYYFPICGPPHSARAMREQAQKATLKDPGGHVILGLLNVRDNHLLPVGGVSTPALASPGGAPPAAPPPRSTWHHRRHLGSPRLTERHP